ncbi:phosphatidylinositol-4-phosphate 5-kinase, putative [Perkinsus marinus ATCC 50983]|uniref:Phosphatidylinositol-4-phosphate 5-kinase, putative n=1 Tax=Perkinsus marinus (strain ATCC 50983 / TXsc) TaxID=423536 RepID=C5LD49_PERM5|nr:phosphatidylinositol-4-phosphate 5-kinase, putative [Perkinsus marinus ATCC 50983]EER05393.1 phosphatidylinositol-4-phosphate 5-kinase, putative [Perkinsus marinus ATCC 50983]|eukprot:XP_002773577.1 phosphatidylinositol-4-phosphate 5-kinase, putative [Perkinsus marinus ATCC 50983]
MWLRKTREADAVGSILSIGNLMEKVLALDGVSSSSEVGFSAATKEEMLHEVRYGCASAGIIDAADTKPSVTTMKTAIWSKIESLWREFEADGGRNFVASDDGKSHLPHHVALAFTFGQREILYFRAVSTQASESDLPSEEVRANISNSPMTHKSRPKHLRGAKLVGIDSANYALAYAMMVGIEATIRAGEQLNPQWPSIETSHPVEGSDLMPIDNVAAAVRRSYLLPPSGSRLSPPHISKPNRYIRRRCCITDEEYLSSLCQRGFSLIEFTTNSKSGEFFFFSHDGKFMLKTISDEEAEALLVMLRDYAHHVTSHRSLLTRMLGLYRLHIGDRYKRWFFVSTSVFDTGSLGLHAQYDLKGSTSKNRKAGDTETVKKDLNWSQAGNKIHVPDKCKDILISTHKADVEFLARHGVTDYSVLVGVHDTESSDAGPVIIDVAKSAIQLDHILDYKAARWQRMGMARRSRAHLFDAPVAPEIQVLYWHHRLPRPMGSEKACRTGGERLSMPRYAARQHRFFADKVIGPHDGLPIAAPDDEPSIEKIEDAEVNDGQGDRV